MIPTEKERLRVLWMEVTELLMSARIYVPAQADLSTFTEYIGHNELGLAADELLSFGEELGIEERPFWYELGLAFAKMRESDKAHDCSLKSRALKPNIPLELEVAKRNLSKWLRETLASTEGSRNSHIDQLGLRYLSPDDTINTGLSLFEFGRTLVQDPERILAYELDLTDGRKTMAGKPEEMERISKKMCCPPLIWLFSRKWVSKEFKWGNFRRVELPRLLWQAQDTELYYCEYLQPEVGYRRALWLFDVRFGALETKS